MVEPTDAPTGYFETDAPIDSARATRHRVELEKWLGRLPEGLIVREAEIWIEGVLWVYHTISTRRVGNG